MQDEELLAKFDDCSLPLTSFRHEEHVRVAYLYLRKYPLLQVLEKFPANLQKFATAHGKTSLYHQTISWAYLFLIHQRLVADLDVSGGCTWAQFKRRNRDLLDRSNPILQKYYAEETLASSVAREHFLMPDHPALG